MFDATQADLGDRYGGHRTRAGCSQTPPRPQHNPGAADDIVALCELSFDAGLRGEGGLNPIITKFSQARFFVLPTNLAMRPTGSCRVHR